jgi:hypothetical protein
MTDFRADLLDTSAWRTTNEALHAKLVAAKLVATGIYLPTVEFCEECQDWHYTDEKCDGTPI